MVPDYSKGNPTSCIRHISFKMRARRPKMAVLPAPKLQNACKKAKNGSFARTSAPKCVQEGPKQRFCPHRRPKMRARRPKMAVLPAPKLQNACRKAKNSGSARTAAPKCVQEGKKWRFCPHRRPKMRAGRPKTAVLPAPPQPTFKRRFFSKKHLTPAKTYVNIT